MKVERSVRLRRSVTITAHAICRFVIERSGAPELLRFVIERSGAPELLREFGKTKEYDVNVELLCGEAQVTIHHERDVGVDA